MKTVRHSTWQGRNTQLHDCNSLRYTEIYTVSGSSVSELGGEMSILGRTYLFNFECYIDE